MIEMGGLLALFNHKIQSGNARGADQAWAAGANAVDPSMVNLFLPIKGFEARAINLQNHVTVLDPMSKDHAEYFKAARETHPKWVKLSPFAKLCHARNTMIVKGTDGVLGYLNPTKEGGGGTGGAARIAKYLGVEFVDVASSVNRHYLRVALTGNKLKECVDLL